MTMRSLLLLFLIALIAVPLFAQTDPPTPTNLTATLLLPGPSVELNWEAPMGMWGYKIYRSTGDDTHFEVIGFQLGKRYYDNTVAANTTYYYRVTAVNEARVESAPSNIASITIGTLPGKGSVKGTVTDETNGQPIPNVGIHFIRTDDPNAPHFVTMTNASGQYEAAVDVGTYVLKAEPPPQSGFIMEWYDNAADQASATQISVTEGSTTTADFALAKAEVPPGATGTIKGTVVDDVTKAPIPNVIIRFYNINAMPHWRPYATTDEQGNYEAVLDTGVYRIAAQPPLGTIADPGYRPEWYENANTAMTATPVPLAEGEVKTIDFGLEKLELPPLTTLEGTVTDTAGNALKDATVLIMRTPHEMLLTFAMTGLLPGMGEESISVDGIGYFRGVVWKGVTDEAGHYSATVVDGESYIALAAKEGYHPEFYENEVSPLNADVITVNGPTTGIDFTLTPLPSTANSISGVVRDESGAGVPSRVVLVSDREDHRWHPVQAGNTDESGAFTISGVYEGNYYLLALPYSDYAPAFYKEGAFGVTHWEDATLVTVSGDISGITIGVVPIETEGLTRIRGRVTADGTPMSGVSVFATKPDGAIIGYGVTDATGAYIVGGIDAGAVTLTAEKEGYTSTPATVNVGTGTFEVNNANLALSAVVTAVEPPAGAVPEKYALAQNFPNPFNPSTTIQFDMPVQGAVRLVIYNVLGQEVRTLVNGALDAGRQSVVWNGQDSKGASVPSSVYFYALTVTGANGTTFSQVRNMILLK